MPIITGNLLPSRMLYYLEMALGTFEELIKKPTQNHRKQPDIFQRITFGLNPLAKLRSIIGTQQSAELTNFQIFISVELALRRTYTLEV